MTDTPERLPLSAERLSHAAIMDYVNAGSANFGEIEVEAFNEWIEACIPHLDSLSPTELAHLGWMHIERAWSRITEGGGLGHNVAPPEVQAAANSDLDASIAFFERARSSKDVVLSTQLASVRFALPLFKLILTGREREITTHDIRTYRHAQFGANAHLFTLGKNNPDPHLTAQINTAVALAMLSDSFLETDSIPLPSALRHRTTAHPAERWHIALHDRNTGITDKIRIAPYGPPDMVLIPPATLRNQDYEDPQGRGTFHALMLHDYWMRNKKPWDEVDENRALPIDHKKAVAEEIEMNVFHQLVRLRKGTLPEVAQPEDPLAYYLNLPPHTDPTHESHSQALEAAISQLELRAVSGEATAGELHTLGWLYIESSLGLNAQSSTREGTLVANLERAEDIFHQAREALPAGTSHYFETTIAEITAPLLRSLIMVEDIREPRDIYCAQLAEIAGQMLDAYQSAQPPDAPEAETLFHMLQQVTIYLAMMHDPTQRVIVIPNSPRQRGGLQTPRGWDFTVWTLQGTYIGKESQEDVYVPGPFYGRLDDTPDVQAADNGIIVVPPKNLGQWTRAHNFRTLRTVLSQIPTARPQPKQFKPDRKALVKAQRHLAGIVTSQAA